MVRVPHHGRLLPLPKTRSKLADRQCPKSLQPSAFAVTGSLDYAWNSFENGINKGIFFNVRRK